MVDEYNDDGYDIYNDAPSIALTNITATVVHSYDSQLNRDAYYDT